MSHVVEVRAKEGNGRSGSYYRGDRQWHPGWQEAVVDDATLAIIAVDPWLEVRELDQREQAARKMHHALVADAYAKTLEATAADARAKADALLTEAKSAVDATGKQPPAPPPPPAPTPFQDSLLAAMPGAEREKLAASEAKSSKPAKQK